MNNQNNFWLWVGVALLVINSSYLAVAGDPGLFHLVNLLLHLALGFVLLLALLFWWRRQRRRAVHFGASLLAAAAAAGFLLLILGNRSALRPLLWLHIGLAVAGLFTLLSAYASSPRRRRWQISAAGFLLAVLVPVALGLRQSRMAAAEGHFVNPLAPSSMADHAMGGAEGPFYPSAVSTRSGELLRAEDFSRSENCAGCHPDVYAEWSSSAHRFSGLDNPWYRKTYERMVQEKGEEAARWCGGCHTPALLASGMLDRPLEEIADTPAAKAGVSCTVCHGMSRVKSTMGQGDYELDVTPLHAMATSSNRLVRGLHDLLVRVDPEPHRRTFSKPTSAGLDSDEACSTCHFASMDETLNDHHHILVMTDYVAWQLFGPADQTIALSLRPRESRSCSECHMPAQPSADARHGEGSRRSHRFATANTALPTLHGDQEQLKAVTDYLEAGHVTVDIFAMSKGRPLPTKARAERNPEIYAPLDRVPATLRRGESTRFDVLVRSRDIGHFFPAGKFVLRDCWLEFKAVDEQGKTVFWNGRLDADGNVDPTAHFFTLLGIDHNGDPVEKYDIWNIQGYPYELDIESNHGVVVRFRVEVPPEVGDELTLTAQIHYRKFRPAFTRWVFSDLDKEAPEVPVVTLAQNSLTVQVVDAGAELPDMENPASQPEVDAARWLDYGYGLANSGDFRLGREAIRTSLELDPTYAPGWTLFGNLEWVAGKLAEAREAFERSLELDPEYVRPYYFLGQTELSEGRYEEAIEYLTPVSERYPRDRMIWVGLGQAYLSSAQYEQAVEALNKALKIGPIADNPHFMLALAYKALGKTELAEHHKQLYDRYNVDAEPPEEVLGTFLRTNPHGNKERQILHEHNSQPSDDLGAAP